MKKNILTLILFATLFVSSWGYTKSIQVSSYDPQVVTALALMNGLPGGCSLVKPGIQLDYANLAKNENNETSLNIYSFSAAVIHAADDNPAQLKFDGNRVKHFQDNDRLVSEYYTDTRVLRVAVDLHTNKITELSEKNLRGRYRVSCFGK